MKNITLYYRPTCPFCQKVLQFMEQNDISLAKKDISDDIKFEDELIQFGGKKQVPCLMIDGKALYESDDIIQWLKNTV